MKLPKTSRRACCAHSPHCAVHHVPYDNGYVACTCALGSASLRHERVEMVASPQSEAVSVHDLSVSARGALIALEAGQREIAARLLADVVARAERGFDTASHGVDE